MCLILHNFQFSHHSPGPILCISHIAIFSLCLAIFHVLQCVFLILHVYHCFLPYFTSYHVSCSFSLFVSFLAIFQILQCKFLIFLVGQFSHHNLDPTVCISHFFTFFQCFSPYSRSYNVCESFSTLVNFLATIQVLQCVFFSNTSFSLFLAIF